MNKRRHNPPAGTSTGRIDGILYAGFVLFAIMLALLLPRVVPAAFQFTPNPFALVSALGIAANLALLVMLFRKPTHATVMLWFALFNMGAVLWGVFEFMQRISATPVGNVFWGHAIYSITSIMSAFLYLFIRAYTNRGRNEGSSAVPAVVLGFALLIAFLVSSNFIFPVGQASDHQAWGYPPPVNPVTYWFVGYISFFIFSGVVRLIGYYRQATSAKDRYQARVLIVAIAFLEITSAITTFGFPAVHFYAIPPLGVLANAIFAGAVMYIIYKYDSFSVNMALVADAVLATMAEAVIITDRHYQVLYANRSAEELFSEAAGSMVDRNLRRIAGGSIMEHRRQWEGRSTGTEGTRHIEVSLTAHNRPVAMMLHVNPVQAGQEAYAFVLSDITQIKQFSEQAVLQAKKLVEANVELEHSQAQLRREKANIERKVAEATAQIQADRTRLEASINSLSVGFIMTTPDGSVLTFNREARVMVARVVGLKPSEFQQVDQKTLGSVITRAFDLPEKIKSCLETRETLKLENLDLLDRVITVYITPIIEHDAATDRILGAVILLEDVTETVSLERSRDEFFSIASHELRTPLTAIRGNTQMMSEYYGKAFKDPNLREMLTDIHDSSIRLIDIVNDFLDTSRLEQGKIQFKLEPCDAQALMQEVIKEIKTAGLNPQVELIITPKKSLPLVLADRDRLKQVFINLIGNALKFTEKGDVTVSFTSLITSVGIMVTDTGKGIAMEDRRFLFHKFQQANHDMLTRDYTRSTGLGLYISRLIMTGMNGSLNLDRSEPGVGSTFAVTVPAADAKNAH